MSSSGTFSPPVLQERNLGQGICSACTYSLACEGMEGVPHVVTLCHAWFALPESCTSPQKLASVGTVKIIDVTRCSSMSELM